MGKDTVEHVGAAGRGYLCQLKLVRQGDVGLRQIANPPRRAVAGNIGDAKTAAIRLGLRPDQRALQGVGQMPQMIVVIGIAYVVRLGQKRQLPAMIFACGEASDVKVIVVGLHHSGGGGPVRVVGTPACGIFVAYVGGVAAVGQHLHHPEQTHFLIVAQIFDAGNRAVHHTRRPSDGCVADRIVDQVERRPEQEGLVVFAGAGGNAQLGQGGSIEPGEIAVVFDVRPIVRARDR